MSFAALAEASAATEVNLTLDSLLDDVVAAESTDYSFAIDRYRESNIHDPEAIDVQSDDENTDDEFHRILTAHRREHRRQLANQTGGAQSDEDDDAEEMRRLQMERMKREFEKRHKRRDSDASSTSSRSSRYSIKFDKRDKDLWELPPIEHLKITAQENVELKKLGVVSSIVDTLVVIAADPGVSALDDNSVLFTTSRHSLGQVWEVFGPVSKPFYTVRFNTIEEIQAAELVPDEPIYYAPNNIEYTKHVFTKDLIKEKHVDPITNEDGEECVEFSDDEQEQAYKSSRNTRGGGNGRKRVHPKSNNRGGRGGGNNQWQQNQYYGNQQQYGMWHQQNYNQSMPPPYGGQGYYGPPSGYNNMGPPNAYQQQQFWPRPNQPQNNQQNRQGGKHNEQGTKETSNQQTVAVEQKQQGVEKKQENAPVAKPVENGENKIDNDKN